MILVEKEKKGHSYATTRHPSLSEEKKAKMKAFTKVYSHKLLNRLKEKGKLRRISSTVSKANGAASASTTVSVSTPMTVSTPSRVPSETPNGSEARHDDLLDEMFGGADEELEGDEDGDTDPSPLDSLLADSPETHRKVLEGDGQFGETPGRTPSSEETDGES